MTISGNYKDSFVGNSKNNTEKATTTANKSMGFDPKATQSCLFLFVSCFIGKKHHTSNTR